MVKFLNLKSLLITIISLQLPVLLLHMDTAFVAYILTEELRRVLLG